MEKFARIMYENKEALYKASAEYFEAQLRFIVKEMCFDLCKKFRIDEDIKEEDFFAELMDAVEEKRCEKKLRIADELEKLDVVKPVEYYDPPF